MRAAAAESSSPVARGACWHARLLLRARARNLLLLQTSGCDLLPFRSGAMATRAEVRQAHPEQQLIRAACGALGCVFPLSSVRKPFFFV